MTNWEEISEILSREFGDFEHHNRTNAFEELVFILLSVRTTEGQYLEGFRALMAAYSPPQLAGAETSCVSKILKPLGFHNERATRVISASRYITEFFGYPTIEPLRGYPDRVCEEFLLTIPGVGKKVARCVMMYALGREVFPVDTHCWRIGRRLGAIRRTLGSGQCRGGDMDRFQAKIPPPLRRKLHVNFVSLGRGICRAKTPVCGCCPIGNFCRRVGVTK